MRTLGTPPANGKMGESRQQTTENGYLTLKVPLNLMHGLGQDKASSSR